MRVREANTRILRAKPRPDMDAMLSNPSLPCATSTESQTRGESNSMQGAGVKESALATQTGTRFPNGGPGGKRVPESALRLGCGFRMMPQAETASRNRAVEWDMLSQWQLKRKVHPGIFVRNGMQFPNEWLAESSSRNPRSERDALSRRPLRPPQLQKLRALHPKTG